MTITLLTSYLLVFVLEFLNGHNMFIFLINTNHRWQFLSLHIIIQLWLCFYLLSPGNHQQVSSMGTSNHAKLGKSNFMFSWTSTPVTFALFNLNRSDLCNLWMNSGVCSNTFSLNTQPRTPQCKANFIFVQELSVVKSRDILKDKCYLKYTLFNIFPNQSKITIHLPLISNEIFFHKQTIIKFFHCILQSLTITICMAFCSWNNEYLSPAQHYKTQCMGT